MELADTLAEHERDEVVAEALLGAKLASTVKNVKKCGINSKVGFLIFLKFIN